MTWKVIVVDDCNGFSSARSSRHPVIPSCRRWAASELEAMAAEGDLAAADGGVAAAGRDAARRPGGTAATGPGV